MDHNYYLQILHSVNVTVSIFSPFRFLGNMHLLFGCKHLLLYIYTLSLNLTMGM